MVQSSQAIELKEVSFSYKNQEIFKGFNLVLNDNQFIAIVGVNGSGKSTFLKLLMGGLYPQSGTVKILGQSAGQLSLKRQMGASLQEVEFPEALRAGEILDFVASQYSDTFSKDQLVKDFFLADFMNKPCSELSGGMKRRLSLACALVGKPKVVLLDEPTTGLDVESRLRLIKNLRVYQKKHKSLLLMISHHPQEITESTDQFLHLRRGEVKSIAPEKLKKVMALKKVSFHSLERFDFSFADKVDEKNGFYCVFSNESDRVVKELVARSSSFKDLNIQSLGVNEALKGFL